MNADELTNALASKFFQENFTKLPPIPDEPSEREEILDPTKPLSLKRRIRMLMDEKERQKMDEYDSLPDSMTFNKFYPQPGRSETLLKSADDPALQHLPLCDRIKYGFQKMYQAYRLANPQLIEIYLKNTTEVHESLFGSEKELMEEASRIYQEDPKKILPFIKGELKGDDYWEKTYEIHKSLCKRKGIPHLQIPEFIPERQSTINFKQAQRLIDDLDKLKAEAKKESEQPAWDPLPDNSEDWDAHFNVKRDPFTGGLTNYYEGLKIVLNPYVSDYDSPISSAEAKKKLNEVPEIDWEAAKEKMDRDLKEWLEMKAEERKKAEEEKKKKEEEKKKKEDEKKKEEEEKKKKEEEEACEKAVEYLMNLRAKRFDPVTGKQIAFSCFPDLN